MDNELFELCKEVYKRFPEWVDTQNGYYFVDGKEPLLYDNDVFAVSIESQWWGQMAFLAPQFASDYLDEKLPHYDSTGWDLAVIYGGEEWVDAGYLNRERNDWRNRVSANTPLKARLRLVIALDDAGVKL